MGRPPPNARRHGRLRSAEFRTPPARENTPYRHTFLTKGAKTTARDARAFAAGPHGTLTAMPAPDRTPRLHVRPGDATRPRGDDCKVIVHCCNNDGGWGSGFVVALSNRWSAPEAAYRAMPRRPLGHVEIVQVEPDTWVANLIGQDGIRHDPDGLPPVRYEALRSGFDRIASWCMDRSPERCSVHMPRIGCALAGGDWALVEVLIEACLLRAGIDVTVYDFPGGSFYDSRDPESAPFLRQAPRDPSSPR